MNRRGRVKRGAYNRTKRMVKKYIRLGMRFLMYMAGLIGIISTPAIITAALLIG